MRHASSYSEAGESRAYEFCTTPLTFLNSPPVCSLDPSTCSSHTSCSCPSKPGPTGRVAPKGVGGYALPRLALAVGIEDRIAFLVEVPGAPRPATVAALIPTA